MSGPLDRVRTVVATSVRRLLSVVLPEFVRRSVLVKFLVALSVIILLGSVVGGVFFVGIDSTLQRQVNTEVRATTQMHATIYDNWFASRQQRLESIANLNFMAGGSLEQASQRLSLEVARSDIYTDMHLLSLNSGQVLASSSEPAIGRNYYNLSVNATILERGDQFVYPGRYRTFGDREVVGLVIRLGSANRMLVAEVDPQAGPSPPQTVSGASTFVVDSTGNVVFGPQNVSQPPPNIAGRTRIVETRRALFSYRQLPGSNLAVVRKTPRQAAFAVKDAVLISFATTLVLVFGILMVVSLVGGRAAVSDLRRLVAKANEMAGGDLKVDLATHRKDEIGELYRAFAEMRDALRKRITEAEWAREDAQEAKQEIEEQKAIISVLNRVLRHNLRNDLVVINGHTSVLREQLTDGQETEHAEKIENRTDDLLDKAEKAREIERLVHREAHQLVSIDVVDILTSEVNRFRREFPEADITGTFPDSASVRAHEALEFVVSNLIENAIEHNDSPQPTVEIEVSESDGTVEIQIADDGPGIPQAELDTLEEGYETAIEHGSGLGLWLVNWLVDAMNGELEFERRDPTGTVVTVNLQSAPPSSGHSAQAEASS